MSSIHEIKPRTRRYPVRRVHAVRIALIREVDKEKLDKIAITIAISNSHCHRQSHPIATVDYRILYRAKETGFCPLKSRAERVPTRTAESGQARRHHGYTGTNPRST